MLHLPRAPTQLHALRASDRGSPWTLPSSQLSLEFADEVHHPRAMGEGGSGPEYLDELEHLFVRTRPALSGWFRRRIGDAAEAEDLAQECFVRIANRKDPDPPGNFEAYLYRTARSVLFDRRRRRERRDADAHVPLLPGQDASGEPDALRNLLARETLQRVTAILATMPERTRSIFILSRLEGMRYAEIATRFDISVSAVQKHILKAIETLMRTGGDDA